MDKHLDFINPSQLNEDSLYVINALQKSGYEALLVGGAVRDLIIGRRPKDFDIVTNATNSQIADIFPNCELIGRRFPIALIHLSNQAIEVSTFVSEEEINDVEGRPVREKGEDRVPGTINEDSARRDFTINAIYYDPYENRMVDIENGYEDLLNKKLKFIGDPEAKIKEDPVRIIRGIRQACQLDLNIDEGVKELFKKYSSSVDKISSSRLREEFLKILKSGASHKIFPILIEYEIFKESFPLTFLYFKNELMEHTDDKVNLSGVLNYIDQSFLEFGRMREPIIFGALQLPKLFREFPHLLEYKKWLMEDAYSFNDFFREPWIELSVKKWVKKKVFDMTYMLRRLMLEKNQRPPKVQFVYKEYFQDLYRFLRFIHELTGDFKEIHDFWKIVRKNTHLANELISLYMSDKVIDSETLIQLQKTKKGNKKRARYFKRKKRR